MSNFTLVSFMKALFIGAAFCVLVVLVHLSQVKAPLWRNLRTTESPAHLYDENDARRTRIKSVCERHHSYLPLYRPSPGLGTNVPSPNGKKGKCSSTHCPLFVDDSRSLAFCSIPKVASTTMKGIFAPLLNVKVPVGSGGYALYKAFSDQVLHLGPRTLLQHSERRNHTKTESFADPVDDNDARRTRIKSVCERHPSYLPLYRPSPGLGTNVPSPNGKKAKCSSIDCPLFVDDSRSLAFCFIPKVASTTFKDIFAPLLNVTVEAGSDGDTLHRVFNNQVLRLAPRTLLQHPERSNYTKVLFVRHPFERIVSTYIDKALRGRKEMAWAYNAFWDRIPGVRAENRSPTFSEFVEFVLATTAKSSDEHWTPYYARCHPCLLDYDFIGKLETADRDFPLFFSLAGIAGTAELHCHDNSRHNVTGVDVTDAKYYFNQLSFDQVMRLYAWYFYDFELFGYDFRDYLP